MYSDRINLAKTPGRKERLQGALGRQRMLSLQRLTELKDSLKTPVLLDSRLLDMTG